MQPRIPQVHLTVPILVSAYDICDEPFNEVTEASEITAEGGFIELVAPIAREHPFLLINMATGGATSCRVASLEIAPNGKTYVGIRFEAPSPQFWGLEFPVEEEVDHTTQPRLVPALA